MAASVTETHTLSVSGRPTIVAEGTAGNIAVHRGESQEVRLVVTKKIRGVFGGNEDELRSVPVDVTQQGDTIHVDARIREPLHGKAYTIDLDFTLPEHSTLDLKLAAGNVRVEHIGGMVHAEVQAGNVDLRDVAGPLDILARAGNIDGREIALHERNKLTVNAGNIDVAGSFAAGTALEARVNSGNLKLRLPRDTATKLEATAQVGSVSVRDWPVTVTRQLVRQSAIGETQPGASSEIHARVDAGNIVITAE